MPPTVTKSCPFTLRRSFLWVFKSVKSLKLDLITQSLSIQEACSLSKVEFLVSFPLKTHEKPSLRSFPFQIYPNL